jgi:hypothetical protein
MNFSTTILVITLLALMGCSRDDSRYELIKAEDGVIRLDKKTGEMIAVSESCIPTLIDIAALKEKAEFDPLLSTVKEFPELRLPGVKSSAASFLHQYDPALNKNLDQEPSVKKTLTMKLQYRWLKGRMDYRMTITPYIENLKEVIRDSDTIFTILLNDADGFEVCRFDAPFASLVQIVGADGKPLEWQAEGSFALAKPDFKRVVGMNYSWRYSDALKKALNE